MKAQPTTSLRTKTVVSGFAGMTADAFAHLGADDAGVRSSALGSLARNGELSSDQLIAGLIDSSPIVARRAWSILAYTPSLLDDDTVLGLLDSLPDDVLEVACFSLGERPPSDALASALVHAAQHADALVRESAVAALGSLGHQIGLEAVLRGCRDIAQVRRRAVIALAAFEGPEVETMMAELVEDRDWQVRDIAVELQAIV